MLASLLMIVSLVVFIVVHCVEITAVLVRKDYFV